MVRAPLTDPELQAVIAAWPTLPEPIRAGILAMVKASAANGAGSGAGKGEQSS
jgi:hypothetical protein